MVSKLKEKWGVDTKRFVIIMIVFSLAGSSIMLVKEPFYHLLHVSQNASLWIKIPVALLIYQVMLLAWGTLLGEFHFFWEKEKKMFRFLLRPFIPPADRT